jgi:hypothetical protein
LATLCNQWKAENKYEPLENGSSKCSNSVSLKWERKERPLQRLKREHTSAKREHQFKEKKYLG